jgi:L-asparagine transporter-like permease
VAYHKELRPRQLQMIAVGGAIGTGLFLGAGGRLASAGPGLFRRHPDDRSGCLFGVLLNAVVPEKAFEIVLNVTSLGIMTAWAAIVLCQLRLWYW